MSDPVGEASALVASAEEATNARDLAAISDLYLPDAEVEVVGPKMHQVHLGREQYVAAWVAMLEEADDVGLEVTKELLTASESVVVAGWHGRTRVGVMTRGVDVFWPSGRRVRKHLLIYGAFPVDRPERPCA